MTRRKTKTSTGPAVSPMNPIIDNGVELQASRFAGIVETFILETHSVENSGRHKAFVERPHRELTSTLKGGSGK